MIINLYLMLTWLARCMPFRTSKDSSQRNNISFCFHARFEFSYSLISPIRILKYQRFHIILSLIKYNLLFSLYRPRFICNFKFFLFVICHLCLAKTPFIDGLLFVYEIILLGNILADRFLLVNSWRALVIHHVFIWISA